MRTYLLSTVGAIALCVAAAPAMADSLTPATFSADLALGASTTISKVGTITAGSPTSAQADVLFVTDTTGSMGPAISEINSTFMQTISALSSLGNVATGAAQYKDATSAGDPFDYHLDQKITTNSSLTQAAIATYSASGGGDDPEQGLYALTQASTASTGFRTGSKKIAVIVGDAPSHSSPSVPPAAGGVSVTSTAAALKAAGVTVEALNASNITGDSGLDSDGQFDATTGIFSKGVAGSYTSSFPASKDLTAELESLISSAFAKYSSVSLALVGAAPSCVSVSLPGTITGSFDRSTTRTFNFSPLSITGTSDGTCSFEVGLEADGALLATESDTITVGSVTPVPEPATFLMLASGLIGLGAVMRRRGRAL
jgi:hypothetical protein